MSVKTGDAITIK